MPPAPFPTSFPQILALPRPAVMPAQRACTRKHLQAAATLLTLWKSLIPRYSDIASQSVDYTCAACKQTHTLSGQALWLRLFQVIGAYYDHTVRLIVTASHTPKNELPPGVNLPALKSFLDEFPSNVNPIILPEAHLIIADYLSALFEIYFTKIFRNNPFPNSPLGIIEDHAHKSMQRLAAKCSHHHQGLARAAQILTSGLAQLMAHVYSIRQPWNTQHHSGPYSAIRLQELSLLAARDESVLRRYGKPHVEKVFEQQLALVLQSFGFVVVHTRRGERTVDLVCISADPREPMTVLVEAKTTKHKYSLPVPDQRALAEYTADVTKNLTSLPKLTFVLLVTPPPARAIEQRLRSLESAVGVPVRLVAAQDLADLREAIPGPLPFSAFRGAVLASTTAALSGLAKSLKRSYEEAQTAYTLFVRTMLNGPAPTEHQNSGWEETEPSHPS